MPSESPKWIALILSLIAIGIGGLSWMESHRNRIINEEINRPVLSASMDNEPIIGPVMEGAIEVIFFGSIKNVGKTSAYISNTKILPYFQSGVIPECKGNASVDEGLKPDLQEIRPGETVQFKVNIKMTSACTKEIRPLGVMIDLQTTYIYLGTGTTYSQQFYPMGEIPIKKIRELR